jgi:hypothetical protein
VDEGRSKAWLRKQQDVEHHLLVLQHRAVTVHSDPFGLLGLPVGRDQAGRTLMRVPDGCERTHPS